MNFIFQKKKRNLFIFVIFFSFFFISFVSSLNIGETDVRGVDVDKVFQDSFFMPLNQSVFGNFSFNGGWENDGLSIIDGDIYAQTGFFLNITSLNVTRQNLTVNENMFIAGDLSMGGQILAGDGTTSNPSISFGSDTNTGFMKGGGDMLDAVFGGLAMIRYTGNMVMRNDVGVQWTTGTVSEGVGLRLLTDGEAIGVLAIKEGDGGDTEVRIYNQDSGANDEFASLGYRNNVDVFTIDSEATGTGVVRNIALMGGDVGIGTSTPQSLLHISKGGQQANLMFSDSANGNNRNEIKNIFSGAGASSNSMTFIVSDGTATGGRNTLVLKGDSKVFINGVGTPQLGIGTETPQNTLNVVGGFNQSGTGNSTLNMIYAFKYGNNAGVTVIDTQNVYVNITNLTDGVINGFESVNNETLRVLLGGVYDIYSQMSFNDGANTEYHLALGINGVRQIDCHTERKIGSGNDKGSASYGCLRALSVGDLITAMVENDDSTTDIDFHDMQLKLVRIGN